MKASISVAVSAILVMAIISVVSAFTTPPQPVSPILTPLSATKVAESELSTIEIPASSNDQDLLTIVPPNEGFRDTASSGEVSIASMNLLAPFYNSLQLPRKTTTDYERWEFLNNDRTQRVPKSIEMAKRTNADVLCLQEIEGGILGENGASEGKEFTLRDDIQEWLAEPIVVTNPDGSTSTIVEGYDSFVWSPLNPNNKRGDVVGLCIAWRSKKHSIVEWNGYRRGMVCMLQEANEQNSDRNEAQDSSASFLIANLHLPARPSNVLERLNTMSKTIRKLSELDKNRPKRKGNHRNTIDGLMVVAGDFNSDQDSVAARLLTHGYTNYGNVRDRNYKAKVTKASASTMSHPYCFIDSYDHGQDYGSGSTDSRFKTGSFRDLYAPVTVSLKGRGPGIMDHLFYTAGTKGDKPHLRKRPVAVRRTNPSQVAMASSKAATKDTLSASLLQDHLGKRSKRRKKGENRGGGGNMGTASAAHYSNNSKGAKIKVQAVLATIDHQDIGSTGKRLKIINEGLPNVEEGFPSDHLPVGVLFSAIQDTNIDNDNDYNEDNSNDGEPRSDEENGENEVLPKSNDSNSTGDKIASSSPDSMAASDNTGKIYRGKSSGISSSVQRRRNSSKASFGLRRRHNQVLNTVTEWLVGRGAASIVLDKPLYKNDLLARVLGPEQVKKNLKKKSRAPDLICVFVNGAEEECLVVVEVAVASDPDKVRAQKTTKYQDLMDLLSKSEKQCYLATIVVQDDGQIPEGTRSDIQMLTQLTSENMKNIEEIDIETDRLCEHLGSKVSSFRIDKR